MNKPDSPILETNEDARLQAKDLLRTARYGALAVIEPETGHPLSSRVAVASDMDGTPLILISRLSGHTRALETDSRCSLLLGEPGKGDPLAHPRISLFAEAERVERGTQQNEQVRARYLRRHPKATLYVDFPDFAFYRLSILRASLNGGFGKAFELETEDMILQRPWLQQFSEQEPGIVEHMNDDHADAVSLYATVLCSGKAGPWRLAGVDPEGVDLILNDKALRLRFSQPLERGDDIRPILVELAKKARLDAEE